MAKVTMMSSGLRRKPTYEEVIDYRFINGEQNQCVSQWKLDAARIKFQPSDTASDKFRIVG